MSPTDKVLGGIGAMRTLVDNFPMSILDSLHGKQYTSIFQFLIDVLNACGVDTNELIGHLIEEIYGAQGLVSKIENFPETIKNNISNIKIDEQSEFFTAVEYAIKGILMSLLTSIFGCSALPVIPNKMLDYDNRGGLITGELETYLSAGTPGLVIPLSVIDPMKLLSISPTSQEGQLYYAVEGGDKFYHKEYVNKTILKEEKTEKEEILEVVTKVQKYTSAASISLINTYTPSTASTIEEHCWGFEMNNENTFEDLSISISYTPYNCGTVMTWCGVIKKGEKKTSTEFIVSPNDKIGNKTIIHSIKINGHEGGVAVGENTWCYLADVSAWGSPLDTVVIGDPNTGETIEKKEYKTIPAESTYTTTATTFEYEYVQCDRSKSDNFIRKNFVKEGPLTDEDDEYIVCYEGLNPNTLYKTNDMNSFIWYAMRKGTRYPQVEYNHMMWDNRIPAAKEGIIRANSAEWNEWYESKNEWGKEFSGKNGIYPIIQLEKHKENGNLIEVHLPAQRYFAPKKMEKLIKGETADGKYFNASIYKFNWEYLNSIQILHPKLLLAGLCESLLGFSFSTINSVDIRGTKSVIQAKLMKAVKNIIETNDMETEDCYMTFTNDDVNEMLEEMMLARYQSTPYGGEENTVRVHDIKSYISQIDKMNDNASQEGQADIAKRLITEVTTSGEAIEPTIEYGLQVSTDSNILEKLLWAITMPIIESIFTPQVMLLIAINFGLMGVTKIEDFNNIYIFYSLSPV